MDPNTTTEGIASTTEIDWLYYAKFAFIVMVTVALGLIAFNQGIGFYYKAQLLQGPCQTCVEANPEWAACYEYLTTPRLTDKSILTNLTLQPQWLQSDQA